MGAVLAFVKSVPVGGAHLRVVDGALTRDGLPHGLDPANEISVEWALRQREAGTVDRVIAVCMGPESAADALRRALAMGCDEARHICDDKLVGADVRATATTLATAVAGTDAIVAAFGYESLDGSSGVVPSMVATLLEWPLLSFAREARLDDGWITVRRDVGEGLEHRAAPLPAVVTLAAGAIEPRYPKLAATLAARRREPPVTTLAGPLSERPGERVVALRASDEPAREATVVDGQRGVDLILDAVAALQGTR